MPKGLLIWKPPNERGRHRSWNDLVGGYRSFHTFQRLTTTNKSKDGRVHVNDLVAALVRQDTAVPTDSLASIKRYRIDRVPPPDTAWRIGEALRECGVPWASGIFALIACGHIGDAIAIVSLWLMEQKNPRRHLDRAWHMIALGPVLADQNILDNVPGLLEQHVRARRIDATLVNRILHKDLGELKSHKTQTELEFVSSGDVRAYVERELAKDAWADYARIAQRFNEIAIEWLAWKQRDVSKLHYVIRGAVTMSEAADIRIFAREYSAIGTFALFLRTFDIEASLGLKPERHEPIRLPYPRPIADRYLADRYLKSSD